MKNNPIAVVLSLAAVAIMISVVVIPAVSDSAFRGVTWVDTDASVAPVVQYQTIELADGQALSVVPTVDVCLTSGDIYVSWDVSSGIVSIVQDGTLVSSTSQTSLQVGYVDGQLTINETVFATNGNGILRDIPLGTFSNTVSGANVALVASVPSYSGSLVLNVLASEAVVSWTGVPSSYDVPDVSSSPLATVWFESEGGSLVPMQAGTSPVTPTEPQDPVRTGWTFAGWYTSETFATEWDWSWTSYADITLFAKWTQTASTGSTNGVMLEAVAPGSVWNDSFSMVYDGTLWTVTVGTETASFAGNEIRVGSSDGRIYVNMWSAECDPFSSMVVDADSVVVIDAGMVKDVQTGYVQALMVLLVLTLVMVVMYITARFVSGRA